MMRALGVALGSFVACALVHAVWPSAWPAVIVGAAGIVGLATYRATNAEALADERARLLVDLQRERGELVHGIEAQVAQLTRALEEKNVLLKEVHHRVKNNLQVITSLLSLQADSIEDPAAREAFRESQTRVQSIALVHDRLYRSEDLVHVDFDGYLRTLVEGLLDGAGDPGVRAEIDAPATGISVNAAIPCGLIVNELVTNAIKHAFPKGQGIIRVSLSTAEGALELRVADDGAGLPAELDPRASRSLGLELVFALADQLDAKVEIGGPPGTSFTFRFIDAGPASEGRRRVQV